MGKTQLVIPRVTVDATEQNAAKIGEMLTNAGKMTAKLSEALTIAAVYGDIERDFDRLEPLASKGEAHQKRMREMHSKVRKIAESDYPSVLSDYEGFLSSDSGRGAIGRAEKRTAEEWGVDQRTINRIRTKKK